MHGVCCAALAAAPLQHAHAWMRAGAWGGHASGGAGGWNYAGARGTTPAVSQPDRLLEALTQLR